MRLARWTRAVWATWVGEATCFLNSRNKVSRADAEPLGEFFDARVVERTFIDEAHRPLNGGERPFPGRREGRRLGPAA